MGEDKIIRELGENIKEEINKPNMNETKLLLYEIARVVGETIADHSKPTEYHGLITFSEED